MIKDKYGQYILSEIDICQMYMRDQSIQPKYILSDNAKIDSRLDITNPPHIIQYNSDNTHNMGVEEFDRELQSQWYMPQQYRDLDIAKWVIDQCDTDEQRQRVGQELLMYLERDLFTLLQYLKYIVDTMREHNIVWGLGRGSSVSSYVLYLIGVHKIDSIYYQLDINEFLR